MSPTKYIKRMVYNYTRAFGEKPRMDIYSPLKKNNHPKLDDSELQG